MEYDAPSIRGQAAGIRQRARVLLSGLGAAVLATFIWCIAPTMASAALDLPGCRDTTLHRNDDESSSLVSLPFSINFYGSSYDSLYVNNNGNVTFDAPLPTYVPFELTQTDRVIIAPFFADVDTRPEDGGAVTYGSTTYEGRPAFCVLWDDVGYFPEQTDLRNTFQLLLVQSGDAGNFDIVFRYESLQWELGSASDGVSARAGFSNGEPANSVELDGSAENGAFLDGGPHALNQGSVNSTEPGTWIFHVRSGTAGNDPRNVPPGFARDTSWWSWPDTDGDGLPDHWESNGVWVAGQFVDLPALGANPNRRDAFIYVDVVEGERWNSTIEEMLRSSFRNSPLGITLHIIRGSRVLQHSEVPDTVSATDAFFSQVVRLGFTSTGLNGEPGSVPALAKYVCVCPDHAAGGGVGGEANGIKADHLIVTVYEALWLEDIERETGISFDNGTLVGDRLNAITTMHELGHLYGLRHHGTEDLPSNDPAYLSIMSYAYNAFGVPRPPDEAIETGELLPRIDYSRDDAVNFDWRTGASYGALSLVYGQHGERDDFYTSVGEIPEPGAEAPVEAGVGELLADPTTREQIERGARDVKAALEDDEEDDSSSNEVSDDSPIESTASYTPMRGRAYATRIARVRGKWAWLRLRCPGANRCWGAARLIRRITMRRVINRRGNRRVIRRKRNVVIGKGRYNVAPRRVGVLRVRLTGVGKRLLLRSRRRGWRAILAGPGLKNRAVALKPVKGQGKRRGGNRNGRKQGKQRGAMGSP